MVKRAQVLLRSPRRRSLPTLRIGQPHQGAVGKLHRADVDRVGLAVLGELCADDPIAAAAIIGGVVVEAPERRAEGRTAGPRPRAPIARWPRQTCSERSRAASRATRVLSRSTTASSRTTSSTPHSPRPTSGGSDGATANSAVSRSRQAEGGGGSSASDAAASLRGRRLCAGSLSRPRPRQWDCRLRRGHIAKRQGAKSRRNDEGGEELHRRDIREDCDLIAADGSNDLSIMLEQNNGWRPTMTVLDYGPFRCRRLRPRRHGKRGAPSSGAPRQARAGARALYPGHDRGSSHGSTRIIRLGYFEHPPTSRCCGAPTRCGANSKRRPAGGCST